MADRLYPAMAVLAGLCLTLGIVAAARPAQLTAAARWLDRRRPEAAGGRAWPTVPGLSGGPAEWLRVRLDRAGWSETPDRFLGLAALVTAAFAAAGAAVGTLDDAAASAVLGVLGAGAGAGLCVRILDSTGAARRRRLLAELAPTLELTCLELGAGSSPSAALAGVTRRTDGELARELRLLLAGATLNSAEALDVRLRRLGERLDLPPLTSLAAVLATSRDYGSGVIHGLRAIAVDLRRAQRRELIASSRSALTRVLVPAAVGVLMPFLAILLYPAITSLAANLR